MSLPSSTALLLLVLSLLVWRPGTVSGDGVPSKPVVTPITKDSSTSLYTIPIKNGAPLVLDLAGNLVWSTCQQGHRTVPCKSSVCKVANRASNRWSNCAVSGQPGSADPNCACTAYTNNPLTGQCFSGDVTVVPLAANATDGARPMSPVSFSGYALCAPEGLLGSLPAGAAGVAGLSREPLSLPSTVASRLKVARQFALCLPDDGQTGAAVFGGGPFQLMSGMVPPGPTDFAEELRNNPLPLLKNPKNGAYYFRVRGIAVNQELVPLAPGALDLDPRTGNGGVAFSTVTPYTTLRPDLFNALVTAFERATSGIPRVKPPPPHNLCFDEAAFSSTLLGPGVAAIDFMLDNGRNWTLPGASSLVRVAGRLCFAFQGATSNDPAQPPYAPAVLFGAHQMKDNLVLFDLEKNTFGFSGLLAGRRTNCGNFNTGSS